MIYWKVKNKTYTKFMIDSQLPERLQTISMNHTIKVYESIYDQLVQPIISETRSSSWYKIFPGCALFTLTNLMLDFL